MQTLGSCQAWARRLLPRHVVRDTVRVVVASSIPAVLGYSLQGVLKARGYKYEEQVRCARRSEETVLFFAGGSIIITPVSKVHCCRLGRNGPAMVWPRAQVTNGLRWAASTCVLVMLPLLGHAAQESWEHILGALAGGLVATGLSRFESPWVLSIGAWRGVSGLAGRREHQMVVVVCVVPSARAVWL